jgi:glycosyltransferase involved in cell wall biosynthesis
MLIDPTRRQEHRRWVKFQLGLRKFAAQEVDVTLATSVPKGASNGFAWAVWGDPALVSRKPMAELHKFTRQRIQTFGYVGTLKKVRARFKQLETGLPSPRQPPPFWYSHSNGEAKHQRGLNSSDPFATKEAPEDGATPTYASAVAMVPQETIDVKLSVVIPTKNAMAEEFESTLQALRRQKGIREIEIVVVDSGSTDNTVPVAKEFGANVYCIPPEQFNHGTTRNYGVEQTSGEILAFMVQDAIPATDDLFYKMALGLRGNDQFAGVSVRQVPKSNADVIASWERWNHNNFYIAGNIQKPVFPLGRDTNDLTVEQLRLFAGLDNSCSMIRREVWEKLKFDTVEYAEDLQFGLRCLNQGYRIGWLPHCSVIHSHTRSALHYLSRYYIDKRVLLEIFNGEERRRNLAKLNPEEIALSVKDLYFAIREYVNSAEFTSAESPFLLLERLRSYVGTKRELVIRGSTPPGEPSLDRFFEDLGPAFGSPFRSTNVCLENFQGILNSLMQFIGERYPRLSESALTATIYKAFGIAAGSFFGEYYYVCQRDGKISPELERFHRQLSAPVDDI